MQTLDEASQNDRIRMVIVAQISCSTETESRDVSLFDFQLQDS